MLDFRGGLDSIAGIQIDKLFDYERGLDGLPRSDVLKFQMKDSSVVVRPSGTEPKLKTYISVTADNREAAEEIENGLHIRGRLSVMESRPLIWDNKQSFL